MSDQLMFRIIMAAGMVATIFVRLFFYMRTGTMKKGLDDTKENKHFLRVIFSLSLLWFASILAFLIYPRAIDWSFLPFPRGLRFMGLGVSLLAVALIVWVQRSLGREFSGSLYIREGHRLITRGPYRWVRHPMYSVFVLMHISTFLLTASWLIGALGLLQVSILMLGRVPREEYMMIREFGEEYREYMKRTGRFLPSRFAAGGEQG